jgi:hypothetical protein
VVLAKHRVDSLREFGVVCPVNAMGINLIVSHPVQLGLIILDRLMASYMLTSAIC